MLHSNNWKWTDVTMKEFERGIDRAWQGYWPVFSSVCTHPKSRWWGPHVVKFLIIFHCVCLHIFVFLFYFQTHFFSFCMFPFSVVNHGLCCRRFFLLLGSVVQMNMYWFFCLVFLFSIILYDLCKIRFLFIWFWCILLDLFVWFHCLLTSCCFLAMLLLPITLQLFFVCWSLLIIISPAYSICAEVHILKPIM